MRRVGPLLTILAGILLAYPAVQLYTASGQVVSIGADASLLQSSAQRDGAAAVFAIVAGLLALVSVARFTYVLAAIAAVVAVAVAVTQPPAYVGQGAPAAIVAAVAAVLDLVNLRRTATGQPG